MMKVWIYNGNEIESGMDGKGKRSSAHLSLVDLVVMRGLGDVDLGTNVYKVWGYCRCTGLWESSWH